MTDVVKLTQELIACPSITPEDKGAIPLLVSWLKPLGFECQELEFTDSAGVGIKNLYARRGSSGPNFCFAGHTDVVPPGPGWDYDPFKGEIHKDILYGRGTSDMKGGIAAFIAALANFEQKKGSVSLLITGDEEGKATHGTLKVLEWLAAKGEKLDCCLVGEPTNPGIVGEAIKIGRRGSLNGFVTIKGVQGHAAYPHLAQNPVPDMLRKLVALTYMELDKGTQHFEPSNLEITTVDVGNPATNVIPGEIRAGFNIRFNDTYNSEILSAWLRGIFGDDLTIEVSGESFLTPPGPLSDKVAAAITEVTGLIPELSTSGGTSDARFIKSYCPVLEFGLTNATIHKANENVRIADLLTLTRIYGGVLRRILC